MTVPHPYVTMAMDIACTCGLRDICSAQTDKGYSGYSEYWSSRICNTSGVTISCLDAAWPSAWLVLPDCYTRFHCLVTRTLTLVSEPPGIKLVTSLVQSDNHTTFGKGEPRMVPLTPVYGILSYTIHPTLPPHMSTDLG